MHIQYNTAPYRKLYKSFIQRQQTTNVLVDIEPRVRGICLDVFASGLGVSVYSCEGHDGDGFSGYIMFAAKNRDSATVLTTVFQNAAAYFHDRCGLTIDDQWMGIEHDLATINDAEDVTHTYPRLIIRSPTNITEIYSDLWWATITGFIRKQLRTRIELQKFLKESK